LLAIQKDVANLEFLKLVTELYGAFVVTFLGVYISLFYSKKQDREKSKEDQEKVYVSSLTLLASELSLNEQPLKALNDAISHLPKEPNKLYENYGFLLEMTKDIKNDVFYNLISSPGMTEISRKFDIFNKVQQAYFNTIKAINGLSLSREVFLNYYDFDITIIPPELIDRASEIVNQEVAKLSRTLEMVQEAKKIIIKELETYKIVFVDEGNIT
jgi:hypothetical protein